jgi:hypothetical protein
LHLRTISAFFFLCLFLIPMVLVHIVEVNKETVQWLSVEEEHEKESSLEWTDDVKEECTVDLKIELNFIDLAVVQELFNGYSDQVHQGYPNSILRPPEQV